MKYRIVATARTGNEQVVERVSLKVIKQILALIRDNDFYPRWVLYCVEQGKQIDDVIPAENLRIIDASEFFQQS